MKYFSLILGLLMGCGAARATPEPRHRAVFELTSSQPAIWSALLENVKNLQVALEKSGQVEIEVIAHGEGIGLLVAAGNPVTAEIQQLAKSGVVFAACKNTMKRKGISADQLIGISIPVDSGVAEVVRKQEASWSYLKTSQ
jgi:intracellular sulfur oxidation DsrE/DsrF family protein